MLFVLFLFNIKLLLKTSIPKRDAPILLILLALISITLFSYLNWEGSFFSFFFYIYKFIIFYFVSLFLIIIIKNNDKNEYYPELILFKSIYIYLFFIILQFSIPDFHIWSFKNFGTEAAFEVIEKNMSGHNLRNLGWNGFLFASDGVAFSFSALFILFYRTSIKNLSTKHKLFLFFIEIICIALALISGRSTIPIVLIYFIFYAFSSGFLSLFLKIFALIVISLLLFIAYGDTILNHPFFVWLLEPITSSISHGKLYSNSTDVTNNVYMEFFSGPSACNFLDNFNCYYYKSNNDYYANGLVGADSGFIRLYYAIGLHGFIIFILMWCYFVFKISITCLKRKSLYFFLVLIFLIYSLAFFYKSEWLYQNFFIFYFFVLYNSIFLNSSKKTDK
ncbi:O-antigen polymerase [Paenalcaligenes sp. Me52]